MPKEYPAEFKAEIIKRYQKGESIQSGIAYRAKHNLRLEKRILFHQNSEPHLHAKRI